METTEEKSCELCKRTGVKTTIHHLIPREEGGRDMATAELCIPCHKQIHALYTNRELGVRLNTIEKLIADEKLSRYLKWLRRQNPSETIIIKESRERRMKI